MLFSRLFVFLKPMGSAGGSSNKMLLRRKIFLFALQQFIARP